MFVSTIASHAVHNLPLPSSQPIRPVSRIVVSEVIPNCSIDILRSSPPTLQSQRILEIWSTRNCAEVLEGGIGASRNEWYGRRNSPQTSDVHQGRRYDGVILNLSWDLPISYIWVLNLPCRRSWVRPYDPQDHLAHCPHSTNPQTHRPIFGPIAQPQPAQ